MDKQELKKQLDKEIEEQDNILEQQWNTTADKILELENTEEFEAGYEMGLRRARKLLRQLN